MEMGRPSVLIVDDLPFMRAVIREALTEGGFGVVAEAENGRDGLRLFEEHGPDAVVLDIAMPVMDGISALRRLVQRHPAAVAVMCSAMGEEEMIIHAIRLGAKDFVVKPFPPERIVSAVRKALRID